MLADSSYVSIYCKDENVIENFNALQNHIVEVQVVTMKMIQEPAVPDDNSIILKGVIHMTMQIKIKYLDETQTRISKIEQGDWIDLRAAEDVTIKKDEFKLVPLGVAMELPEGYEAHVVPRSSTYKNFGVIQTNSMGVIDESYKGDNDFWFFPAYALRDTEIKKGDRICQFRIMKKMPAVELIEVELLGNEDRGGHGSTGTK